MENGVRYCLIDASGDIRATEPPPGHEHWTIEIETGIEDQRRQFALSDSAVATSGDLRQGFDSDGVRYSHVIDPRSGMAVTGSRVVTVIAADATTADALASVVSVMGEVDGIQHVESWPEAEARVVWRNESDEIQTSMTSGFPDEL